MLLCVMPSGPLIWKIWKGDIKMPWFWWGLYISQVPIWLHGREMPQIIRKSTFLKASLSTHVWTHRRILRPFPASCLIAQLLLESSEAISSNSSWPLCTDSLRINYKSKLCPGPRELRLQKKSRHGADRSSATETEFLSLFCLTYLRSLFS